ncbi:phosphatase PAP2 family protein [Candidatus Phytoplasma mali]|nr:phosphatase PAP2 family protein [Candidatus Phytoplasma mali]
MIKNKKNIPIIKKYIFIYFLIIGTQFISYFCLTKLIVFLYYSGKQNNSNLSLIGFINNNNIQLQKILNLGFCDENGKFPDHDYLKYLIYIYLGIIYYWYLVLPYFFYQYLDKKQKKQLYDLFIKTLIISYIIFIILPIKSPETNIISSLEFPKQPNIRNNLTNNLLNFTYQIDNDRVCSCPSLHVLFTYISFVIFRSNSKIPKSIIYGQLILTILVWVSTFALKQHFIIDGIISTILTEIVFILSSKKTKNKITN